MRKNYRAVIRRQFTLDMWYGWLDRLNNGPTPQHEHLAGGIKAFRQMLAKPNLPKE